MTVHHLRPVPAAGHNPAPRVLEVRRTLPGRDLTTPGAARRIIGARALRWGLPSDSREALEQITAELTANAVEHAPADHVVIHMLYVPHSVTLTVTSTTAAPADLSARQAASDDERGRGLAIVEALATAWGCTPAPQAGVWARLDLHQPPETRPAAETDSAHSDTAPPPSASNSADSTAELEALVAAGGFWRLTPEWMPRRFDPRPPSAETLRTVAALLTRRIS
ncbi:ATP-binding protein [Streptomyces sp. NPDC001251]